MKKVLNILMFILIIIFLSFTKSNIVSTNKNLVELINCIDGDTANIKYDGKIEKIRFLAINTKEIGDNEESYGKEASIYTCEKLTNAKKIEIEFDELSNKYDKYERLLAWVFVDDKLLQLDLVRNGYAEVKYDYDKYKYLSELKLAEKNAKEKKLGLWKIYY